MICVYFYSFDFFYSIATAVISEAAKANLNRHVCARIIADVINDLPFSSTWNTENEQEERTVTISS